MWILSIVSPLTEGGQRGVMLPLEVELEGGFMRIANILYKDTREKTPPLHSPLVRGEDKIE